MSTTSSTRRAPTSTKTSTTGVRIAPSISSTRPSLPDNNRVSSTLSRPTASSTSKANTPLLQPKRPLQPAHIRHQKSNSLSSISSDTINQFSYSGASQYLNLETKKTEASIPGITSRSSKVPTSFPSRIPVRSSQTSSMLPSKKSPLNSSSNLRSTVLQPKTNLTTVSSVNGGSSTAKNTRISQTKTSNGSGSLISKPPALAIKANNVRLNSQQKPPLPINKPNNTALPSLRKQGSLTQLNSSSNSNRIPQSTSKILENSKNSQKPSIELDKLKKSSHRKSLSISHTTSTSSGAGMAITKKPVSGTSRPSGSSTSMAKTSLSSSSSRIRVSNGAIRPPPKSPAVNGVVSNTVASLKPSLPLKSASAHNTGLYSKSSSNLGTDFNGTSTSKLTTASLGNKELSVSPKSYAKAPLSSVISKSFSTSRPRLADPNRTPLKATSDSKLRVPKSSIISSKTANYNDPSGLTKKSSLSHSFTPRAVPKELSQIPSPPVSSQLSNLKRGSSINGSQAHRKSNLHSPMPQFIDRAPSAVSMTSNYFTEPLLPEEVLKTFGSKLTSYEHKEILEYPRIYYFGANAKKFQSRDRHAKPFSTQEGDLLFEVSDHLAYRYEIQKTLGKGSFGQVVRAYDYKVGREVAIKIIRNSERFHRQALTEIQLLEALTRWDKDGEYNVLHILENFFFRGHLCIVTELYGINLYEYIKQNQFAGFRLSAVRNFAIQILKCLSLLNSHNVIHCDLKPENILLAGPSNSSIKVIDFGSSCFTSQRIYTYIQSRFYRSPEVILELPYGTPIDMWSFGCILAELSNGHPIFPGETEAEQMACILEVLGFPDPALLAKSRRRYSFFDVAGNPRPSLSPRRRRLVGSKPLSKALKSSDEQFIDFVARCLEFSPDKRITPDEALNHPWIVGPKSMSRTISTATGPLYAKHRTLLVDASESPQANRSGISSRSCAFSDLETDNGTLHSNSSDN